MKFFTGIIPKFAFMPHLNLFGRSRISKIHSTRRQTTLRRSTSSPLSRSVFRLLLTSVARKFTTLLSSLKIGKSPLVGEVCSERTAIFRGS